MKYLSLIAITAAIIFSSFSFEKENFVNQAETEILNSNNMKLGAFSLSLSVKDLEKSKQFYENLGFEAMGEEWRRII